MQVTPNVLNVPLAYPGHNFTPNQFCVFKLTRMPVQLLLP